MNWRSICSVRQCLYLIIIGKRSHLVSWCQGNKDDGEWPEILGFARPERLSPPLREQINSCPPPNIFSKSLRDLKEFLIIWHIFKHIFETFQTPVFFFKDLFFPLHILNIFLKHLCGFVKIKIYFKGNSLKNLGLKRIIDSEKMSRRSASSSRATSAVRPTLWKPRRAGIPGRTSTQNRSLSSAASTWNSLMPTSTPWRGQGLQRWLIDRLKTVLKHNQQEMFKRIKKNKSPKACFDWIP